MVLEDKFLFGLNGCNYDNLSFRHEKKKGVFATNRNSDQVFLYVLRHAISPHCRSE